MMMYREHTLEFVYHLGRTIKYNFYTLIPLIIGLFGLNDQLRKWLYLSFIFYTIAMFFYSFEKWRRRNLVVTEGFLEINEGVFERIQDRIPVKNIHHIHIQDTFLKRLFRVSIIEIDIIGNKNITFNLHTSKIPQLKHALFHDKEIPINKKKVQSKSTFKHYLLMATSWKESIKALPYSTFLLTIINGFLQARSTDLNKNTSIIDIFKKLPAAIEDGYLYLLFTIAIFICVNFLLSLIRLAITYQNFDIKIESKHLSIRQGYFNRIHIKVSFNRIRSFSYSQNLVQKLMGWGTLHVETAGESNRGSVVLHPMIKKYDVPAFLETLVPSFEWHTKELKPEYNALVPYLTKHFVMASILVGSFTYAFGFKLIFLAVYLSLIHGWMNWKWSGLSWDGNQVLVKRLRYAVFTTHLFKRRYIEDLEVKQLIHHKNIATYVFSVFSKKEEESYAVRYLPSHAKISFLNHLKI